MQSGTSLETADGLRGRRRRDRLLQPRLSPLAGCVFLGRAFDGAVAFVGRWRIDRLQLRITEMGEIRLAAWDTDHWVRLADLIERDWLAGGLGDVCHSGLPVRKWLSWRCEIGGVTHGGRNPELFELPGKAVIAATATQYKTS